MNKHELFRQKYGIYLDNFLLLKNEDNFEYYSNYAKIDMS